MSNNESASHFKTSMTNFAPPLLQYLGYGDLNNDGIADFLGINTSPASDTVNPLRVALGKADGTFSEDANLFVGQTPGFVSPHVLISDFNGDGFTDLVVYDGGVYDWTLRLTLGREPLLFLGDGSGKLTPSTALQDGFSSLITSGSESSKGGIQTDRTMGVKSIDAADIDGDGDLDLWVESTGSANITSHFMINNSGTFTVDLNNRLSKTALFGPMVESGIDFFRYGDARFFDINSDNSPDLFLGQIRDDHSSHISQSSFIVINDGSGYFPDNNVIRLPLPDFYQGFTSVQDAESWDINGDGLKDVVLVHTRNDDVSGSYAERAWSGTYLQVLIQTSAGQFVDQTAARIGDQTLWSSKELSAFQNAKEISTFDLNNDGLMDFVLSYNNGLRPSDARPMIFMANGNGSFTALDADVLTGGDAYFGEGIRPLDIGRDGFVDFVHLDSNPGANGVYDGGGDDFNVLVIQTASKYLEWRTFKSIPEYTGSRNDYTVDVSSSGFRVTEKSSGDTDNYLGIERIKFSDHTVAYDISGNAGEVAKILGAVLGNGAVNNKEYVGIGLDLLDNGMEYQELMDLAIATRLGGQASDEAVVELLFDNVVGVAPSNEELNYFANLLESGYYSRGALGVMAADTDLNAEQIGLIGLAETGIAYFDLIG